MTLGGFLFGIVAPAVIVAVAWGVVLWHERDLRKCHQETAMTIAERVAEIEATIAAILAGKSGWPPGLWDPAVKRIEATAEMLMMTDEELTVLSAVYQTGRDSLGPTSGAILIEIARRSTPSAHQRIAETVERRRLRAC